MALAAQKFALKQNQRYYQGQHLHVVFPLSQTLARLAPSGHPELCSDVHRDLSLATLMQHVGHPQVIL